MSLLRRDFAIPVCSGLRIMAKSWGKETSKHKILCLHGWLDNAASFNYLGPRLAQELDAFVCSIDLPGHGLSEHLSSTFYSLTDYTSLTFDFVEELAWDEPFTICCHSMGGAVGLMMAGTMPERVHALAAVEGFGALSKPPAHAPKDTRRAIETRRVLLSKQKRVYPSLDAAAEARCATAKKWPGNQHISFEAAKELVERGTQWIPTTARRANDSLDDQVQAGPSASPEVDDDSTTPRRRKEGGFVFRHDVMLSCPTPMFSSEDQVRAYLAEITCPTLFIGATHGWPVEEKAVRERLSAVRSHETLRLEGAHHLHIDPESREVVGDSVIDFIRRQGHPETSTSQDATSSSEEQPKRKSE